MGVDCEELVGGYSQELMGLVLGFSLEIYSFVNEINDITIRMRKQGVGNLEVYSSGRLPPILQS